MKKSTISLILFNFCVVVNLITLFFMVINLSNEIQKQNINTEKKYNDIINKQIKNEKLQEKVDDFILERIYDLEGLDNNYCNR